MNYVLISFFNRTICGRVKSLLKNTFLNFRLSISYFACLWNPSAFKSVESLSAKLNLLGKGFDISFVWLALNLIIFAAFCSSLNILIFSIISQLIFSSSFSRSSNVFDLDFGTPTKDNINFVSFFFLVAQSQYFYRFIWFSEQPGFRAWEGCSVQIFALRNIVEQCIEWNALLFVNFVDFRKAFGSIHRYTLSAVVRHYGLPKKIVSLIKMLDEWFECVVILKEGVSDFFEVQTGVRQGCMIYRLLFLILIDYVERRANEWSRGGIQWGISPVAWNI